MSVAGFGATTTQNAMIKRFVIAAIIVAVFLGGVGYFNLVFKPKMIAEFIGKMVPPPATVTAENGEDRALDRPGAFDRHAACHRGRGRVARSWAAR